MANRPLQSIQSIIRNDVISISIILIVFLYIFTLWKEADVSHLEYTNHEEAFSNQLEKDLDTLILQSEFADSDDINLYFSNLKFQYDSIIFCIETTIIEFKNFSCGGKSDIFWKQKRVVDGLSILFKDKNLNWLSVPLRALRASQILLVFAITLIFSAAIFLRLRLLFSYPLLHFDQEIRSIQNGKRKYTNMPKNRTSEWAQVEENLRDLVKHISNQELIVANSARLDLAWEVAHDIRSPLTFLNLFASQISSAESEHREGILQATSRINKIADDLLKIRKGENADINVTISGDEISNSIQDLILEKKTEYSLSKIPLFRSTGIEAHRNLILPLKLESLIRMISNFLNNAIEATEHGFRSIIVELVIESKTLRISVRDNGVGISQQDIELIFNGRLSSKKPNGNGLGLFQAIKKAESAGGSIEIQSARNIETAVILSLPLKLQSTESKLGESIN